MRFKSFVFYQTALSHAIENGEVEIVKHLLSNPKIDISKVSMDIFIILFVFNSKRKIL